jgi:hypothetical protein
MQSRNYYLSVTALLFSVIALGLTGWMFLTNTLGIVPWKTAEPKRDKILVTRTSLLQGDTARLAPHMGFIDTACAKVDFDGKALPVRLELTAWNDGKQVRIFPNAGKTDWLLSSPGEITLSLKKDGECDGGEKRLRATISDGSTTFTCWLCKPKLDGVLAMGSQNSGGPVELATGKSVIVWHRVSLDQGVSQHFDTTEERVKSVHWAMMLKLSLREPEDWEMRGMGLTGKENATK